MSEFICGNFVLSNSAKIEEIDFYILKNALAKNFYIGFGGNVPGFPFGQEFPCDERGLHFAITKSPSENYADELINSWIESSQHDIKKFNKVISSSISAVFYDLFQCHLITKITFVIGQMGDDYMTLTSQNILIQNFSLCLAQSFHENKYSTPSKKFLISS